MREAVAESERPVMLYSIGKDSAVMLHLARKAFYPSPPPFPLLHVDTTWKFRAMYEFRDEMAAELGMELLVHQNPECVARGINPFDHGSAVHTDMWKTAGSEAGARQVRLRRSPSAAPAATRRSRGPRSGSSRSARRSTAGTRSSQRPELWRSTTRRKRRARASACSRCRTGPSSTSGSTSTCEEIPIVPLYFAARAAGGRARRHADHGRRRPDAAASRARCR